MSTAGDQDSLAGAPSPSKGKRFARRLLMSVAVTAMLAGATILISSILAPEATEMAYGKAKVATEELGRNATAATQELVGGEKVYPQIVLGVSGDQEQLDYCDGTFTEMLSYERDGVPPVWAAHNGCGGDILLPWEVGTEVQIQGQPTVYRVAEVRPTQKTWASTEDLVGLQGNFALQTCFYGEDRMKFVGLEPVG